MHASDCADYSKADTCEGRMINMAEQNETNGQAFSAEKKGVNADHVQIKNRRRRYSRPRNAQSKQYQENADDMVEKGPETEEEDPLTDDTQSRSAQAEHSVQETAKGDREFQRRRTKEKYKNRFRDQETAALPDTEGEVFPDSITETKQSESEPGAPFSRAKQYTETEEDIIGREVFEAVAEERLEAAIRAANTDDAASLEGKTVLTDAKADAETEVESVSAKASAEMQENETISPEKVSVEVVGVRFKAAGKVYYFDPDGNAFHEGDEVIVETARGIEFGFVVGGNRTVIASEIVSPLKKILRRATEEDRIHYEENNRRREEAFAICREKIAEHNIEMKLVDVEYTFDNNKLLFYFTADGRVDFRELVKDLASVFRTRIELRQIGIRDEAKLMGGLGVCGRPFCCHSFLSDFVQVSIKMAKEQNLSLNSAKISGTCGRLMCCLRYEYDVYEEELKKTPKLDTVVETPDGEGIVCEIIPLAGLVRVKFLGNRSDVPPKLYHRDDVKVRGKMNWKSGSITYHDDMPKADSAGER